MPAVPTVVASSNFLGRAWRQTVVRMRVVRAASEPQMQQKRESGSEGNDRTHEHLKSADWTSFSLWHLSNYRKGGQGSLRKWRFFPEKIANWQN